MDDVSKEAIQVAPDTVGKQVATIPVALSTRFLALQRTTLFFAAEGVRGTYFERMGRRGRYCRRAS